MKIGAPRRSGQVSMVPGEGVLHPLGDVDGVISDALQIFGDHQQVDAHLSAVPHADAADQLLTDLEKQIVHHVVGGDHCLRQTQVLADKGVHAVGNHLDGGPGHVPG